MDSIKLSRTNDDLSDLEDKVCDLETTISELQQENRLLIAQITALEHVFLSMYPGQKQYLMEVNQQAMHNLTHS